MAFFCGPKVTMTMSVGGAVRDPLRVAILGFGTVGRSVARMLVDGQPGLRLACVFNRDVERKRVDWVPEGVRWTDAIDDALAAEVDVVVELVGGVEPAATWMRQALAAGKSVVTGNKQAIAHRGPELFELARARGVRLGFEASVGGGIPAIRGIQEGLAADELTRVQGILNGTCNFILTRMEAAPVAFAAVVAEAQAKGYAEADPSADLDGFDAQAKLAILSAVGLRRRVDPAEIPCCSIRGLEAADFRAAGTLGRVIRQVSVVERVANGPGVRASVGPALVLRISRLAQVLGSENVVVVDGVRGGQTAFIGQGAGGGPTAVAVVSDLRSIVAGDGHTGTELFPASDSAHDVTTAVDRAHYLRIDEAAIADERLSAHGIAVARRLDDGRGATAVVTAPCAPAAVRAMMTDACGTRAMGVALPLID